MKILLITENYFAGGMDRFINNLINYWPDRDDFILVCNKNHPGLEFIEKRLKRKVEFKLHRCITKPQVELVYLKWPAPLRFITRCIMLIAQYLFFLFYIPYFYIMIKQMKPDRVIVCNGGYPGGDTCRAAAITGLFLPKHQKPLFIYHAVPQKSRVLKIPIEYFIDWLVEKGSRYLVTVSQNTQSHLDNRPLLGSSHKKSVIYNGIEGLSASGKGGIREELGIPDDAKIIFMMGTYEPRKGHDFLLRAFSKVIEKEPNAYLLMAGYGYPQNRDRIQKLIEDYDLGSQAFLLGFRDDPQEILKESRLLAVPSQFHESFGLTIVEAMSLRIPIVATNIGGIPEVLKGDRGGFLVSGDEEEFADRMLTLLRDNDLSRAKGEEGYQTFQDRFRVEKMSSRYHELLS